MLEFYLNHSQLQNGSAHTHYSGLYEEVNYILSGLENKINTTVDMLYINHSKEVYMANILPETEVRGSLQ